MVGCDAADIRLDVRDEALRRTATKFEREMIIAAIEEIQSSGKRTQRTETCGPVLAGSGTLAGRKTPRPPVGRSG